MTGIILSGGKSKRMGTNKALLEIKGQRLIDRTASIMKSLFDPVIIVTNTPLVYLDLETEIVTDLYANTGALGGIYTGLFYAPSEQAFVIACDMPFIDDNFIKYMIDKSKNFDIVVPKCPDGLQPLHAIYSKKCLPRIENLLKNDDLKITGFYKGFKLSTITANTIRYFDPEGKMFINANSRQDIESIVEN
jgi:molybdopterin-guanine dinucleotide biosynthesis protein A